MSKENYAVHIAHCCYIHGCKYGDKDCPVVSGEVAQRHPCYDCDEEYEPYTLEEIELLRKTKSYRHTYKQVKDKKISDLEAKLAESEEKCKKAYQEGLLQKQFDKDMEIEQLKQQLHDLPKKIIDEIEKNTQLQSFDYGERYCEEEASNDWAIDLEDLKEILDTILKKYGEGK